MRKIGGKGNWRELHAYARAGLKNAELYLDETMDVPEDWVPPCDILQVHAPPAVRVAGTKKWTDVQDPGRLGRRSREIVQSAARLARRLAAPMVFHIGYRCNGPGFDIAGFAEYLRGLEKQGVSLRLENDALWVNSLSAAHRPVLCLPADFEMLSSVLADTIGFTLDWEHLAQTLLFCEITGQDAIRMQVNDPIDAPAGDRFYETYHRLPDLIKAFIEEKLAALLAESLNRNTVTRVRAFHLNGSDLRVQQPGVNLPCELFGEHLPPFFNGSLCGRAVRDTMPYKQVSKGFDAFINLDAVILEVAGYEAFDIASLSAKWCDRVAVTLFR